MNLHVGDTVHDKRIGQVLSITGDQIRVAWDDGIERDHRILAMADVLEVVHPAPPPDPAHGFGPGAAPSSQVDDVHAEGTPPPQPRGEEPSPISDSAEPPPA